jgi:hypothetical protein
MFGNEHPTFSDDDEASNSMDDLHKAILPENDQYYQPILEEQEYKGLTESSMF